MAMEIEALPIGLDLTGMAPEGLAKSQCGAALCPESGDKRKSLVHARNDVIDPKPTFASVRRRSSN